MKYICIDSNIYRGLFSHSKDFRDDVRSLLEKLINNDKAKLLLPLQVRQEVERNRYSEWCHNDITRLEHEAEAKTKEIMEFQQKYGKYKESEALHKCLVREKSNIEAGKEAIEKRYLSNRSKENSILRHIFSKAEDVPESQTILEAAKLRFEKRNPPRDANEHMGDSIIWECLLAYFKVHSKQGDQLILVSNDTKAWGNDKLDLWLAKEWKDKTKRSVRLIHSLADISDLTKSEQAKIRQQEQEELKRNIIADFVSSNSFVAAGENANRLLSVKASLTKDDLAQIVDACLHNSQIYRSFFTRTPLAALLLDEGNTAILPADGIDDKLWEAFCSTYRLGLLRHKDALPFQ